MAIAYLDTFSGISGDMTVGAFLDLGMPLDGLERGLAALGVDGFRLEVGERVRSGIRATKLTVDLGRPDPGVFVPAAPPRASGALRTDGRHGPHRPYRRIRALLDRAALPARVRDRAQRVFRALAVAEGKVHGVSPDEVVFHEVGAVDAIVDVVGTALCLEHFGVDEVLVSPLPLGSGFVRTQHGVMPVPAPATLELLTGFPVRPDDGATELVTPTGAAIVAALARPGAAGDVIPRAVGYGAGERELADRPNLLRVILGERAPTRAASPAAMAGAGPGLLRETMVVIEANVDDMNPEILPVAVEALLAAGARDVTLAPVTMKKGRPGTLLQIIAEPAERERIAGVLLRETSTIGVRTYAVERLVLPREEQRVTTRFGEMRVKVVTLPDGSRRAAPEHEDCLRAARKHDVPLAQVQAEAMLAAHVLISAAADASRDAGER
ncbi:nickel pincer cofactor biosynthesis protein LarC [Candidatus Binatia bacterium]|nr:nickel pincer cofactor biosynthesis protein LarC [Candidatus Binatia bacterium]